MLNIEYHMVTMVVMEAVNLNSQIPPLHALFIGYHLYSGTRLPNANDLFSSFKQAKGIPHSRDPN